ncbi:diguanylate cyclase domain-containing protein [Erythrobacter sp. R86502]|uniref:diguanylate cyclase domain-containing protein n=1 Tax=Erythrobacter sp. R86502 TaxID=3093846 RepID=UPI0036D3F3DF
MVTGIEVPFEMAMVLAAACAAAGAWAGQSYARCRLDPRRGPLRGLMNPAALSQAVDLAIRRDALRQGSHAVLQGRFNQRAACHSTTNDDISDDVRQHVAAVMRAGLRQGDRVTLDSRGTNGDRFTVRVDGADERSAVRIAARLRRRLTRLRMPQSGSDTRFSASFGVAAGRFGGNDAALDRRARQALKAALAKGQDYTVPASEIEEVLLLPAPALPSESAA